jgi:hypothetical protein
MTVLGHSASDHCVVQTRRDHFNGPRRRTAEKHHVPDSYDFAIVETARGSCLCRNPCDRAGPCVLSRAKASGRRRGGADIAGGLRRTSTTKKRVR